MSYIWFEAGDIDVLYVFVTIGAIYWYLVGSLMSGETGQMSPRVRRSLPQSLLGRMLGTWFNPGAETGYVFAVLNVWSLALFTSGAAVADNLYGGRSGNTNQLISLSVIAAAYVTAYLGFGRLIIRFLRRYVLTGLLLPFLIHMIFAAGGVLVPFVIAGWLQGFAYMHYSSLQVTNWAWTAQEAGSGRLWSSLSVPIGVGAFALAMLIINLLLAMREVEQTRLATPERVIEDELELHPEKAEQPRPPSSPWDE